MSDKKEKVEKRENMISDTEKNTDTKLLSGKGSRDSIIVNFHKRNGARDRAFMLQQNSKYRQNIFNNVDLINAPDDVLDDMVGYLNEEMDRGKREIFDNDKEYLHNKELRKEAAKNRYKKKLETNTEELKRIDELYSKQKTLNALNDKMIDGTLNIKANTDTQNNDLNDLPIIKPLIASDEVNEILKIGNKSIEDNQGGKLFELPKNSSNSNFVQPEVHYTEVERNDKRRELTEMAGMLNMSDEEENYINNRIKQTSSTSVHGQFVPAAKKLEYNLPFYNKLISYLHII